MEQEPLYPFSISTKYRFICPKGASGECPGYRQYRTRHTVAFFYCHDRVCLELFPQMLRCPCRESELCEGNHWDNEEHICNRQERLKKGR